MEYIFYIYLIILFQDNNLHFNTYNPDLLYKYKYHNIINKYLVIMLKDTYKNFSFLMVYKYNYLNNNLINILYINDLL